MPYGSHRLFVVLLGDLIFIIAEALKPYPSFSGFLSYRLPLEGRDRPRFCVVTPRVEYFRETLAKISTIQQRAA
jgi:hypothetical protein